jgi:hypothetical protein
VRRVLGFFSGRDQAGSFGRWMAFSLGCDNRAEKPVIVVSELVSQGSKRESLTIVNLSDKLIRYVRLRFARYIDFECGSFRVVHRCFHMPRVR